MNTGTTHLNGFVSGRQAKTKKYAQSVALSLLKLIPSEQSDDQQQQRSSVKNRQSSRSRQQAERANTHTSMLQQEEDTAGSYQHTIFNPGAVI